MEYIGSPFLFPLSCSFSFQFILRAVCGILVPWPGMKPGPRAWGAYSLNRWTFSKVPKWNIQRYNNQERSRINEPSLYTDRWCSADHKQEKHEGKGQLTISQMTLDTKDKRVNLESSWGTERHITREQMTFSATACCSPEETKGVGGRSNGKIPLRWWKNSVNLELEV